MNIHGNTLPETNSSHLKIGRDPNRKGSYSSHPFLGAMLVSGRVHYAVSWSVKPLDDSWQIVEIHMLCWKEFGPKMETL